MRVYRALTGKLDVNLEWARHRSRAERCSLPRYQADRTRISTALVRRWVPEDCGGPLGGAGIWRSQGCPPWAMTPSGCREVSSSTGLNGSAQKGYTTLTGSEEVKATSWSDGKSRHEWGNVVRGNAPRLPPRRPALRDSKSWCPFRQHVLLPIYRSNGLCDRPGGYWARRRRFYDFIASGDSLGRGNCDRI